MIISTRLWSNTKFIKLLRFVILSDWGIYTVTNAGFDFNSQPTYDLVIKCSANGGTDTETFTVQLTENQAPVISNLPRKIIGFIFTIHNIICIYLSR